MKRDIPRCYRVDDLHVDQRPADSESIVEVEDGRLPHGRHIPGSSVIRHMAAGEAHDLGKQRARRRKRGLKARGNRHERRTSRLITARGEGCP